jgi:protein-S-isoprenylcysteine O-methyltransferase Ste14
MLILLWTGIVIFFIGAVIRWTAIFQLRKEFTVDVSISKNHKIKDDGLYRYIRHPSYLGLLLEFLGFSLLYDNWYSLLIINIPIFVAMVYRIKIEEELLTGAFGIEYENYKRRTKRIIPGIL